MSKCSAQVVIVGAGVAGITSAAWLINNGILDVVILEAQDYVGGRVKGHFVDGHVIDLGAQFIHGREGNPAFDIADKLGRIAFPDDKGATRLQNIPREYISSKGERVPYEKPDKFIKFLWSELDTRFNGRPPNNGANDGQFFEQAYNKFLKTNEGELSAEDKDLYDAVYRWNCFYHKLDNAVAELKDLSVWGASKYKVLKGDRFTDPYEGMAGILKAIADLVPKNSIQLNIPVKEIDWSAAHSSADGKIVVTCQNGNQIEADHVIMTISIGCMQAVHKEMFQPSLPQSFITALNHLGFGAIGKVFLKWEKPFWKPRGKDYFDSFELLWLESHPIILKSDKCEKKTRLGKPWWFGLNSIETVLDQPNILELWLTLDQVEIAEHLSDDEVKAVLHELLQIFLKDYNVPEPIEIYRTKWLTNPYTRGTYSYPACAIQEDDYAYFGKPLPSSENPRLLFAGEAYTLEFISTFHGAYLTGIDQANLLLKTYGIQASGLLVDLLDSARRNN